MYIIAKNKDYYDGVVGSVGMDKTLVYERTIKEITEKKDMLKEFQNNCNSGWHGVNRENHFTNINHMNTLVDNKMKYDNNRFFIIGFCGKLYLGWKFSRTIKVWGENGIPCEEVKTDIIYGYDNAKEFLKESYWRSNIQEDIDYIMNYDSINMFRELKSPIFIYDSTKPSMIINPILKEWEFYKIMDAFTAFQEISMFLGGVLGIEENKIIEIEDKYKIPQHGFNKWSFRREPTKKK